MIDPYNDFSSDERSKSLNNYKYISETKKMLSFEISIDL